MRDDINRWLRYIMYNQASSKKKNFHEWLLVRVAQIECCNFCLLTPLTYATTEKFVINSRVSSVVYIINILTSQCH